MEQADVNDKIIVTITANPSVAPEEQEPIIKIDSGIVTPTERQVSDAFKKAESAIKPKTAKPKHKTKSQGKKRR